MVVRSNRWATVAQFAKKVHVGFDRKLQEYKEHHSLLIMGLHSHRPIRMPMLTPVHGQKLQQWQWWVSELAHTKIEEGGLTIHVFFYITWTAVCVYVTYLRNTWHQDAL